MVTKRSSEALTALASFLNITNWPRNFAFPSTNKQDNFDTGLRCADRDRLVREVFLVYVCVYVCMYILCNDLYVYICVRMRKLCMNVYGWIGYPL